MYISPIDVHIEKMRLLTAQATEEAIVKAVWNMGVTVDKDELSLALQQDRKRYETAYERGWNDCKKAYEERIRQIEELARKEVER